MKIALAGKGGVGKSTLSAALITIFAEKGHQVFAVDADPDANLGLTLGFPSSLLDQQPPIVEMKDLIEERTGKVIARNANRFTVVARRGETLVWRLRIP